MRQLFLALLVPLVLVLGVCSDDDATSSSGPDTGGAGTGGTAIGGAGGSEPTLTFDVVILGAGSGGIAAAIAAARLGASVMLVEQTDWIGGQGESDLGETAADGSGPGPFQVPLTALVPEEVDGFLAAEKNIGVSRLAAGAIRLQPITMLTGQAAGVMAALAASDGVPPRALRTVDVQRVLLDQGSSLSRFVYADVPKDSVWWKAVQLVSTHEIMVGTSATTFLPDASATRAQAAVVLARLFALDTSNPPATPSYDDVPTSHFAYAAIEAITSEQWTTGCSAAPPLFCPDAAVTRAQLAVLVVRALGLDPASAPTVPLFDDVPATHQFFEYSSSPLKKASSVDALPCPTCSVPTRRPRAAHWREQATPC